MLSDFNCKIFDIDKFDALALPDGQLCKSTDKIFSDLAILDKCDFHTLVCLVDHDEYSSVRTTLHKVNTLKNHIKNILRNNNKRKFSVSVFPRVCLSCIAPYIENINSLTAGSSNYIFLSLPLALAQDDFDEALNKILYNCKLLPIFTDCQIYRTLYSDEFIKKLIRIKGAVFQFSLKNESFEENISLIKQIYANDKTVLLGTGCDHNDFNKSVIVRNLKILKNNLGADAYTDIVLRSHGFLR